MVTVLRTSCGASENATAVAFLSTNSTREMRRCIRLTPSDRSNLPSHQSHSCCVEATRHGCTKGTRTMNLERLKDIHNGEKVQPTFSAAEFERRLTNLRKHMADDGLDAVLFTSYHNINYYSRLPLHLVRAQLLPRRDPERRHHGLGEHRRRHALAAQLRRRTSSTPTGGATTTCTPCSRCSSARGCGVAASGSRTTTSAPTCGPRSPTPCRAWSSIDVAAADDAAADGQVAPRRSSSSSTAPGSATSAARPSVAAIARGRPGVRGRPRRHPRDGPRDRQDLPARRTAGHLGVVPVRDQHRRRPQLGDQPRRSSAATSCRSTASR